MVRAAACRARRLAGEAGIDNTASACSMRSTSSMFGSDASRGRRASAAPRRKTRSYCRLDDRAVSLACASVRTLADGYGYIHRRRAAQHRDRHRLADAIAAQSRHEILGLLDRFAVERDQHVADHQSRGIGGAVLRDLADQQPEALCPAGRAAVPESAPASSSRRETLVGCRLQPRPSWPRPRRAMRESPRWCRGYPST